MSICYSNNTGVLSLESRQNNRHFNSLKSWTAYNTHRGTYLICIFIYTYKVLAYLQWNVSINIKTLAFMMDENFLKFNYNFFMKTFVLWLKLPHIIIIWLEGRTWYMKSTITKRKNNSIKEGVDFWTIAVTE